MNKNLSITVLGCGPSSGMPRLGGKDGSGDWGACDPNNLKNHRRRCSVLVGEKTNNTTILIDSGPDIRAQLLDAAIMHLDAVLYTHAHADHIMGIDELRGICQLTQKPLDIYADEKTLAHLQHSFQYAFQAPNQYDFVYKPNLIAHQVEGEFTHNNVKILPLVLIHGQQVALGFRLGNFAYCPDVSDMPAATLQQMTGLDLLIIDAFQYAPHGSHAHLAKTLKWIEVLKPNAAVLTNLGREMDYNTLKKNLPSIVRPAYDGLVLKST